LCSARRFGAVVRGLRARKENAGEEWSENRHAEVETLDSERMALVKERKGRHVVWCPGVRRLRWGFLHVREIYANERNETISTPLCLYYSGASRP